MEHLGAGLAALGVLGPGIGIGILAGMSSSAIGRNPDAAGQIRGLAIILAAFAVVVLGGLGSVWGAYLGGLIVGVVEALAGYYIDPVLRSAVWFLIFLIVLIARPSGLLGQVGAEEVGFREQH